MGAWFEAQILKVTKGPEPTAEKEEQSTPTDEDIRYHVKFEE